MAEEVRYEQVSLILSDEELKTFVKKYARSSGVSRKQFTKIMKKLQSDYIKNHPNEFPKHPKERNN